MYLAHNERVLKCIIFAWFPRSMTVKIAFVAFKRKERLKRQKIAKSSICFEFQVVVAVVGFKWHRRGNAKNAD
ncbi:hypothetical protein DWV53_10660 [Segatella copri]|uniref:Uncharacterized protein n=1 Tax=Segatella copri TaxID=165179 RepID=A0AA92W9C7_9BACT|nr:hypothetical protein DWV53_10660 [Segatella copri]